MSCPRFRPSSRRATASSLPISSRRSSRRLRSPRSKGRRHLQRAFERRCAAAGALPRQRVPHRAELGHAGRRARPVPRVEEMAPLAGRLSATPADRDMPPPSAALPAVSAPRSSTSAPYTFEPGSAAPDTGHQQIQSQMPMLTQGAPDHDVVMRRRRCRDVFGDYLLFRTAEPRPSPARMASSPSPGTASFEQYAGTQMQNASRNGPAAS